MQTEYGNYLIILLQKKLALAMVSSENPISSKSSLALMYHNLGASDKLYALLHTRRSSPGDTASGQNIRLVLSCTATSQPLFLTKRQ
jgi:hypothetical protein